MRDHAGAGTVAIAAAPVTVSGNGESRSGREDGAIPAPARLGGYARRAREFGAHHGLEARVTARIVSIEGAWTFTAQVCHLRSP